jgi:ATP-binding cassette subfamily B protein
MSFSSDGRGLDVSDASMSDERRKLKLRPLTRLVPYIARYRGRAAAALAALVVAALTTLMVPVAVRRMIDFGFSVKAAQLIDSYFVVMIFVVAVLAVSSALRFYLVTTLGERIVADLRADVFDHLTSLSPAYFDAVPHSE